MSDNRRAPINQDLIIDVGMSDGNDTQFYLQKGFTVFGVEADPVMADHLRTRFAGPIAAGQLMLVNSAASSDSCSTLTFWRDEVNQGLSSLKHSEARSAATHSEHQVPTIAWPEIVAQVGVPYYCKIDIEGAEAPFLESMRPDVLPTYVSVEAHTFTPVQRLFDLGYRHFKLIDQNIFWSFPIPNPPLERRFVGTPNWSHASGPFGRELPGDRWLDFAEVQAVFDLVEQLRAYRTVWWSWMDCHAWLPTPQADSIHCVIDRADAMFVAGWAYYAGDPDRVAKLNIYIGGERRAVVVAEMPRPDVLKAGFPSGRVGFSYAVRPLDRAATGLTLEIRDDYGNPVTLRGICKDATTVTL